VKIAARRPVVVDRDNFDQVLARHNIELRLGSVGKEAKEAVVRFASLDDFHPDIILERVGLFQTLRQTRMRLQNSATFADAAAEVRSWANVRPSAALSTGPEQAETMPQRGPSPLSTQGLFDQILDESQPQAREKESPLKGMDWNAYIQSVIGPYAIPGADPQQAELIACVDAVASRMMRAILHHPDFQAIEAAWRAIYFLVRRLETDAQLTLSLLDISKQEIACDLAQADDLRSTGLYKLLVDQAIGIPGGQPWTVLVGNYPFDHTREEAELLGRLGLIAQHAGAPFLGAAHPHSVGCESLVETPDPEDWRRPTDSETASAWAALRQCSQASYLGLALPRFLLRLPYGKATNPIEQFDFDELGDEARHEDYLWANPAFACAYLLAQTFTEQGWSMRPGGVLEIAGLPVHVYAREGESEVKPCAEVVLTERALEKIASHGLMPLVSYRGRDFVRLPSVRSLAGPLAGRWAET
jgi:type VI secretion system protein ImpC